MLTLDWLKNNRSNMPSSLPCVKPIFHFSPSTFFSHNATLKFFSLFNSLLSHFRNPVFEAPKP